MATLKSVKNKKKEDKENKKKIRKKSKTSKKNKDNDKKKDKNDMYSSKEAVIIMIFSLGIGFIICFVFMSVIAGKNYFSVMRDLDKVIDTYYAIVDNYYGDLDKDKLVDGAVEGMISTVDDVFTSYTDSDNAESFNETINGSYEGIGCTVATYSDGSIVVIDVFDGTPSDTAGIKKGDIIISVDGISYEDKTSDDLSSYIKNSGKDSVVITVKREEEIIDITVNLDNVEIPYVSGEIIEKEDKKLGYIIISLFSSNSYEQFKNKLEELEKNGIDSLIIDVRDNSGGFLSSVNDICSLFLDKGDIIYQLEDTSGTSKTKDKTKDKREYDIVVLVNGNSASASEILASAIKESYGGYILGTNTFGKGTVQQTKKLLDGSMIKYTIQKWLTPLGNSIDGIGITPDYVIQLSDEYYNNPSSDTDNQLQEAINLLIK